jgi:hypothetical protein
VEGKSLAVDGTMVRADASPASRVPREQLKEVAQVSRTVEEYLAELDQVNPVSGAELISTTDPDAILTSKGGGTAAMAYYDNYLIDTTSRVILGVEATAARFSQETAAAQKMVEQVQKLGLKPESLGADKAYGSGEFLAWLLDRGVQPHIPVIDRRHALACDILAGRRRSHRSANPEVGDQSCAYSCTSNFRSNRSTLPFAMDP